MKENRSLIVRGDDTWYFVKSIVYKLKRLSKRKAREIIKKWLQRIDNENSETLKQLLKSLLRHITNSYHLKKTYPKYHSSRLKYFEKREVLKKKWLQKVSKALVSLEKMQLVSKTLVDKKEHSRATGCIDTFNSLLDSYAPKQPDFEQNNMDARVKLAVVAHNYNACQDQNEKEGKFVDTVLAEILKRKKMGEIQKASEMASRLIVLT